MNIKSSFNEVNDLINSVVHYEYLPAQNEVTTLPDGTQVIQNDAGKIIFASYSSGVKVILYDSFVLCTNLSGEHWFGDQYQNWYRLD